ncbi:MAG: TetR/AcrR family transcriptional regulator [Pseudomonadota bacterium]|nr:TetR/AcrR family transcriptional regulator [Pseudomonadota bacterium]
MSNLKNRHIKSKSVVSRIKNEALIDRRRKQIVQGAVKVFSEKGFHKATVREIAEASGITLGTMYNYVRTKEDILFICYEYMTTILSEGLKEAICGLEDPREELRAILRRNMDIIYAHQDVVMFLYQESGAYDQEAIRSVLSQEMKYIELFEEVLRRCFQGKKINEFRLRLAADILSYMPVILVLRRWSLNRRFESMEEVKEGILDFLEKEIELIVEDHQYERPVKNEEH